ncbi:MAG: DUF2993 domain-containing protein [Anaerolineales bacterium]|nr:DUF2993 domain-containing protein [Anaerolineales bacterium]
MKDLAIGCLGAILGLVVGIALTFGAMSLLPKTDSSEKVASVISGSRGDVTITVSAKYLNAQLQQLTKQTGLAKQATLTLVAPNIVQVVVAVDTKILGQTISGNAIARLRVSVQNGRVALAVEKIDVSGIGVSQSLVAPMVEQVRTQAEDQINKMIQRELQGTGLRLSNVRVAPNEIAVDLVAP